MPPTHPPLTLHTFYRSSCSARIRIALAYKSIPITYIYHDLPQNDHLNPSYATINPGTTAPTLTFPSPSNPKEEVKIRQSVAILEYLEEAFPHPDYPKLLPGLEDPLKRARVRDLVNIFVAGVQPPTSQLSLRRVEKVAGPEALKKWAAEVTIRGLRAYDGLIKEYGGGGEYSVGDEITLADVCLAPAVEQAFRWEVDVQTVAPEVWRVWGNLKGLEAFRKGEWRAQEDTPVELSEGK